MEYGPQYDAALHVLLWELLSKLEKLLPVPDLKQVFTNSLHPDVPGNFTRVPRALINSCTVITDLSLARLGSFCLGRVCPVVT